MLRWLLLFVPALVAACASTSLRDSWMDPQFTGAPFRKWIVVGAGASTVAQRTLEDVMVGRLRERGVQAAPGWQYLPDGQVAEAQLDAAVAASGADALMLVRLHGVETRTQVSTQMVPAVAPMMGPSMGPGAPPGFAGRGGWWGTYTTWVAVPDISQYTVANVETMVYQVSSRQLVWAGSTQTFDPTSVAREAQGFSSVLLRALAQNNLVPAAP